MSERCASITAISGECSSISATAVAPSLHSDINWKFDFVWRNKDRPSLASDPSPANRNVTVFDKFGITASLALRTYHAVCVPTTLLSVCMQTKIAVRTQYFATFGGRICTKRSGFLVGQSGTLRTEWHSVRSSHFVACPGGFAAPGHWCFPTLVPQTLVCLKKTPRDRPSFFVAWEVGPPVHERL